MTSAISLEALRFVWPKGPEVLNIPSLEIIAGERVFLHGESGSGKSTLLGLFSGVLVPGQGALNVLGVDMVQASGAQRDRLRASDLGVIFQMFNLLPFLSVLQNVTLACQFSPERKARLQGGVEANARDLLGRLGLAEETLLARRVGDLSVGQQQRVAVARALLGGPKLVIADEPTSALDGTSRDRFMALLFSEIARLKATLILVSHDEALSGGFDRCLDLAALNQAGLGPSVP